MSYQVIARKYRPQRFSDVVGQEHVTQTLGNAIAQKRIAHAYLFCGPRGTGKTTIARIFAKCLNCTDGPKIDFPDSDPRCQEITEGRSLDVLEIDGASNRGIDEIRELRDTVRFAPASSRFKIFIIDEVHMLTKEAFNALLKTLEEPPAHVKFMFATTEPEKVLPTILSRCQRFDLKRISSALIVKHLAYIAGQEKVRIEEGALHAIARGADGGMRDAESTLDQLISFCGEQIVEGDVLSMFGLTAQGQIFKLAEALLAGDADVALRLFDELATGGKDLARLLADLLGHFRNLLVFQVSKGDTRLLEISEAEGARLKAQTGITGPEALTRIMEVLTDAEWRLREAASKRIFLEVTLLKTIQARQAVPLDAVLRQLQQLRAEAGGAPAATAPAPAAPAPAAVPAPSVAPAPKAATQPVVLREERAAAPAASPVAPVLATPTPAPQAAAPAQPATPVGTDLNSIWNALVEAVARASSFTKAYLLEAHPVAFAKGVLTIGFPAESADHIGMVDNAKTRALLQTKLQELGYANGAVKFVQEERPTGWVAPVPAPAPVAAPAAAPVADLRGAKTEAAPAPPAKKEPPALLNKDDFKNDPLIKQALEIFKGQIIEVRAQS